MVGYNAYQAGNHKKFEEIAVDLPSGAIIRTFFAENQYDGFHGATTT